MPAAVAVPAAISAGSSILGGVLGNRAAGKAAQLQYQSTQEARKYIEDLLDQYNPKIGQAAQEAADAVTRAGGDAQQAVRDALAQGRTDLAQAIQQNRTDVQAGMGQATDLLKPYVGLGADTAATLKDLMVPGGELNRTFNYQDIQNLDPGYQFRMDQAAKALQASAAAKGGALGGGTLQALGNQQQQMASAEAQNAFSRLTQSQQDRFNRLNALLGAGQTAATQTGNVITRGNEFLAGQGLTAADTMARLGLSGAENIGQFMVQPAEWAGTALTGAATQQAANAMSAGRSIADLITGGGAARAAGTVGGANAWTGALGGVANAAGQVGRYYQDRDLMRILRNPAVTYS